MISRRCFLVQILLMLPSLLWTMSAKCCFLWNDMCSRGLDLALQGSGDRCCCWRCHILCVLIVECHMKIVIDILNLPGWLLVVCRWDDFPWWPPGAKCSSLGYTGHLGELQSVVYDVWVGGWVLKKPHIDNLGRCRCYCCCCYCRWCCCDNTQVYCSDLWHGV